MRRRARVICVLLTLLPCTGLGQLDTDKLVREYAKKLAKERDPKERASAAHWLGGRDNPEAVAALARALSDPDASVRHAAASALWDTGKGAFAAKPELQKALDDPDPAVVARAAGALAVLGVPDTELAGAWRRALEGARDDATAFLAARGLIGIDPPETLAPPILTWLSKHAEDAARPRRGQSSDDTKSAEAAANALERLLTKNAAPVLPLLDRTVQRTPESGRYVFGALASLKKLPPGTVDLALSHTGSPEAETRRAAILLAGKVRTEREAARWIPEAVRLLDDGNEGVRMEACWALKGMKGLAHEAAPDLTRLVVSDRSIDVRRRAASALGEIGDAANPVPKSVRIAVAAASKAALAAAMKDKDHELSENAVIAYNLLYLDTREVVAALADVAVSGADVSARQRALQCLRNRQGQSKPVLETIRPLTSSSEKNVDDEARAAVEWIERGGAGSPAASQASVSAAAQAGRQTAEPKADPSRPPEPSSPVAAAGGEERGLAVLRERKLELDENSFYRALSEGDGEAIRAYLDAGMSAKHVFTGSNRRSPLMILFFGGQACAKAEEGREIVALLLKRGADVNQVDENRNTALMFAADKCDRPTLRLLLKAGARIDAKNGSGLTALQMGIVSGNPGLEELIAAGARLDAATAKAYAEAYKGNPRALTLVKRATGSSPR
jgi:HEAT repeat protein